MSSEERRLAQFSTYLTEETGWFCVVFSLTFTVMGTMETIASSPRG